MAVARDKGYSASTLRNRLRVRDIEAVIPCREDEAGPHAYDYVRCLSGATHHRAGDQSRQVLPPDCDPVREAGQQLPGDGHDRLYSGAAVSSQIDPVCQASIVIP